MDFEWDNTKNQSNKEKHEISFEEAKEIFADSNRLEFTDKRKDYGEVRKITIGAVLTAILFVVFTIRNGAIRLISARKANKEERQMYNDNLNAQKNGN